MRRPAFASLAFGLLLAGMAAGQLSSFGAFERALEGYAVSASAGAVPGVIVAAELVAAAGLLASASAPRFVGRVAGVIGFGVATFWAILAVQAFARGLELDNCGCFGAYLAQPLRWWVLLEDAYFLLLAWFAAAGAGVPIPQPAIRFHRAGEAT